MPSRLYLHHARHGALLLVLLFAPAAVSSAWHRDPAADRIVVFDPEAAARGADGEPREQLQRLLTRSRERHLRLALSSTDPPFLFLHPPASLDADMAQVQSRGVLEPGITALWMAITRDACAAGALVVDVGLNFGWFTLLSAALGCRVVAFEPVPLFRDIAMLARPQPPRQRATTALAVQIRDISDLALTMQRGARRTWASTRRWCGGRS